MYAAMRGHTECVRLLVESGVDKDSTDIVRGDAFVRFMVDAIAV